jgi:predicted glycosyltransferase
LAENLLFVLFDAGETNGLIPVIREAKKDINDKVTIISLAASSKILKRKNIPFKTFQDYISKKDIDFSVNYNKISYDHSAGFFIPLRNVSTFKLINKIIETEKPDVIITGLVSEPEFDFLKIGKKKNIPTCGFYDFYDVPGKNSIFWKGLKEAEHIFVSTEEIKQKLIVAKKNLKLNLIATGHPNFSRLSTLKNDYNRIELLKRANLKNKRYFIFTTQYSKGNDELLILLIEILKEKHKNFNLIIAAHPNQDPKHYKKIIEESGISSQISLLNRNKMNVYEAMLLAEIVFTQTSTTGFEAVLLDKDLIHIFPKRYNPMDEYTVKNKLSLYAKSNLELIETIDQFLNNENVKKIRENVKKCYPLPYAEKNIINFIKKIKKK